MDEVAEQGFAAHWKYKEGGEIAEDEGELNDWLRTIKEILDDPQPDAMDFLDAIKLNLFASEIFVFTPKGEIKTMPAGCTALDFAFQIHTFLGSHCIGAKVNHKLVPLSHKLQSGDQVEILTSKSQHVQPSWTNFVYTAKAKGKILAILRRDNREVQKKGEAVLNDWLKNKELELTTSVLDKLCEFHDIQKHENFFLALGEKTIILSDKDYDEIIGKKKNKNDQSTGWRKYVPFLGHDKKKKGENDKPQLLVVGKEFDKKRPCKISEETIDMYIFPHCCHPIPGDDILGYIDNKNQIEIHKRACPVASKLKSSFGNRILDAKWEMHRILFFDATIEIHGIDRKGMLRDVSEVISEQLNVNIHKLTISSDEGIFEGSIEIRVHDRNDVKIIMDSLKKIDDIQEIQEIM
jgi:GTP pyrophosphokinase